MRSGVNQLRRFDRWVLAVFGVCLAVVFSLSAAEALAEPTIKFGVITTTKYPITRHQWWGPQMAAEEINAAGGINIGGVKHKIELIKAESNELASVTDAANAMEKLLTVDKVAAVTGGLRGEAVLAMMELMADHKTIFISSGSGSKETSEKVAENYDRYKYYFRNTYINTVYMGKIQFALLDITAAKVREVLGIKTPKVALLMEQAMWGNVQIEVAKKLLPEMGMEIVGVWRPSPHATDVTAELTAIKSAGAHMIFTGMTGPGGPVVSGQWGQLQIPATLSGYNGFGSWEGTWKATGGMCAYEITYDAYAHDAAITPKTIPFMEKYIQKYGEKPLFVAGAYDALYIWKEAVERAGTIDADKVVAELEKTDYIGTYGRVAFHPKGHQFPHDVIWGPGYVTTVGFQWRDGKQVCVWPNGEALFPALSTDPGWKGLKYPGTKDVELPPWMVEYWKDKK